MEAKLEGGQSPRPRGFDPHPLPYERPDTNGDSVPPRLGADRCRPGKLEQAMTEKQINTLYWRATLVLGVGTWIGVIVVLAWLAWRPA